MEQLHGANIYEAAKPLFVDSEENSHYVTLARTRLAYSKLVNSLKNPFKIILLHGRPGTGKSYLLYKFYQDFKERYPMFLFKTPTFNDRYALMEVYKRLFGDEPPADATMHWLLEAFGKWEGEPIYILLDEAQLYTTEDMEWIRILSNEAVFKFIISVHKVHEEDILAKAHFKTRTFETIEFRPIDPQEIPMYIEQKLAGAGLKDLLALFTPKNFRAIYRHTDGNLRNINRLMHRLLEMLGYLHAQRPFKLGSHLSNKYIDMAAMDLELTHGTF